MASATKALIGSIDLDKAADAVKKLLEDKGWKVTKLEFTGTETTVTIVMNGYGVSDSKFEQEFYSEYWWGTITLFGNKGTVSDDTLNVVFQITHHAKPHPNVGDTQPAKPANPTVLINSGTEGKSKSSGTDFSVTKSDTKWVDHPAPHSDQYVATLTATVHAGTKWCDILSWDYKLEGKHVSDKPISLRFTDSSAAAGAFASITLEANENVRSLASVTIALEFDPDLTITPADVVVGPLLSHAESSIDLDSPGLANLVFRTANLDGPGTLATLNFHLPAEPTEESYVIHCSRLEGADATGSPITIGTEDANISVVPGPLRMNAVAQAATVSSMEASALLGTVTLSVVGGQPGEPSSLNMTSVLNTVATNGAADPPQLFIDDMPLPPGNVQRISPNSFLFSGIRIDPPGIAGRRTLTLSNFRGNAQNIGPGGTAILMSIQVFPQVSVDSPQVTVARVRPVG
jgi:hypothetical protein